jgi:hypothetical protein
MLSNLPRYGSARRRSFPLPVTGKHSLKQPLSSKRLWIRRNYIRTTYRKSVTLNRLMTSFLACDVIYSPNRISAIILATKKMFNLKTVHDKKKCQLTTKRKSGRWIDWWRRFRSATPPSGRFRYNTEKDKKYWDFDTDFPVSKKSRPWIGCFSH